MKETLIKKLKKETMDHPIIANFILLSKRLA